MPTGLDDHNKIKIYIEKIYWICNKFQKDVDDLCFSVLLLYENTSPNLYSAEYYKKFHLHGKLNSGENFEKFLFKYEEVSYFTRINRHKCG